MIRKDGEELPAGEFFGKDICFFSSMFRKPTKEEIQAAAGSFVPDLIAKDLHILFCGINPGLYSAAVGHHFARPGNRFWPALHASGFTETQVQPYREKELLALGLGITNIVDRATVAASELSDEELVQGRKVLEKKIKRYTPSFLTVLGITAYRTAFDVPDAVPGLQREQIGATRIWLLPSPSGLNAHFKPADLADCFRELRIAAMKYRKAGKSRK